MKRAIAALAFLFSSQVAAEQIAFSWPVIDTLAMPCDSRVRWYSWANGFGKPILIVKARQWTGVARGLEADVDVRSFVLNSAGQPERQLVWQQLDLYNSRSIEQEREVDFGAHHIPLNANETVILSIVCHPISGGGTVHGTLALYALVP